MGHKAACLNRYAVAPSPFLFLISNPRMKVRSEADIAVRIALDLLHHTCPDDLVLPSAQQLAGDTVIQAVSIARHLVAFQLGLQLVCHHQKRLLSFLLTRSDGCRRTYVTNGWRLRGHGDPQAIPKR